jgi:hypothetical protein
MASLIKYFIIVFSVYTGDTILIQVEDNGIGRSGDIIEDIFLLTGIQKAPSV